METDGISGCHPVSQLRWRVFRDLNQTHVLFRVDGRSHSYSLGGRRRGVEMPDLLHEDIQWAFTSVILEWKGFGSGYKHVSGGDTDEESRITHVI